MIKCLLCVFSVFVCSAVNAVTLVDFSGPSAGDIVTNQFPPVSISLLGSPPIPGPRIYSLTDNLGNPVDVLGANGNAITPGNNLGGINPPFFDTQFSFATAIDFFSLQVLDAEAFEPVTAHAFLDDTPVALLAQQTPVGNHNGPVFNGPVLLLSPGAVGGGVLFNRVVVDLEENEGPELYDNLRYNQAVPEASSLLFAIPALSLILAGKTLRR